MIKSQSPTSQYFCFHAKYLYKKSLSGPKDMTYNWLKLYNPKTIKVSSNQINMPEKLAAVDTLTNVLVEDISPLTAGRSEKKNKNHSKQNDALDSKKNKLKNKKKPRAKIHINDDDDNIDPKYSNTFESGNSLSLSLMRPIKPARRRVKNGNMDNKNVKQKVSIQHSRDKKSAEEVIGVKPTAIGFTDPLSIQELSATLSIPPAEIIKSLFLKGIAVTMNQVVDIKMAQVVAESYGIRVEPCSSKSGYNDNAVKLNNSDKKSENLTDRLPVISIFGHVDHGKTTLLDTICETHKVEIESGGITQSIAAHEIQLNTSAGLKKVILLDTPGHEAFADMRMRSIQVTDIGILVVAADDGLQPQSKESINYLKNNSVPFVVAINKIDKPGADPSKIKEELAKFDILNHEWGGQISIVEIDALHGTNVNKLLDVIVEMAEVQPLKADYSAAGSGTILDAYLDIKQGPIANLLIQNGTIKTGDYISINTSVSKIRSIFNYNSLILNSSGPSSIVNISGLESVPVSGSSFKILLDQKNAKKQYVEYQKNRDKNSKNYKKLNSRITFDSSMSTQKNRVNKSINIILKTDSEGTIEAILNAFSAISQSKVQLNIISAGVGQVTSNDIDLAAASSSIVLSFNNVIASSAYQNADKNRVILKNFVVIYDLIDHVQDAMLQLVEVDYSEVVIGRATVQDIFTLSKGNVAGCTVISGKLKRSNPVKVFRDQELLYSGRLSSLKRVKEDAEEVGINNECGLMCGNFSAWQKNDIIEAYELIPQEKTL
uniref:Translation initiation factor IF-2, chloroplastic n=1 Tax=Scinaia undulata TaxID=1884664 RepID=A0A1G4NY05_9FLOR|nr:Translation initiation factor 2 [Scinaia undulata]SCW23396.1 Translation initiation factor 2 [Scinaia undulata]